MAADLPAYRRPLVPFAAALILGIALAGECVALTALALAGLVAAWRLRADRRALGAAGLLLTAALGAWRAAAAFRPDPGDVSHWAASGYVTLVGVVDSDVDVARGVRLCRVKAERLTTSDGATRPVCGVVNVALADPGRAKPLEYGDRVRVRGPLDRPETAPNPGGFDQAAYLARHGVYCTLYARRSHAWTVIGTRGGAFDALFRRAAACRRSMEERLARLLPPAEAGLLSGIVLGARSEIPASLADDFAATGTAHIVAASGLNVTLLAAGLTWLLRVLGVGRRRSVLAIVAALAFYTLIAGATPSILRADLMATLLLAGYLVDRDADALNSLAAAAIVILALTPGDLFDAGFQLSFAVTGWVLALMPRLAHRTTAVPSTGVERIGQSMRVVLVVSLVAQLAAAPLMAYHFGLVPLAGFVANALVVPPVGFLMIWGIALWWLSYLPSGLAHLLASAVVSPVLATIIGVVHAAAALPGASAAVSAPAPLAIAAYYACLAAVSRALGTPTPRGRRVSAETPKEMLHAA